MTARNRQKQIPFGNDNQGKDKVLALDDFGDFEEAAVGLWGGGHDGLAVEARCDHVGAEVGSGEVGLG